jgi:thiol:disulfide interchange protein DsbG
MMSNRFLKACGWLAAACVLSAVKPVPAQVAIPVQSDAPAAQSPTSSMHVQKGLSPGIPRRLARATWIVDKKRRDGAPAIYVFTDPECPYCHRLWQQIHALKSADVEFRYVLVGVIGPQSSPKAAAILQSSDPAQALVAHEAQFPQGGITPAQTIRPDIRETLEVNAALMDAIGIIATPGMIIEDREGKVSLVSGLPSETELSAIVKSLR